MSCVRDLLVRVLVYLPLCDPLRRITTLSLFLSFHRYNGITASPLFTPGIFLP